MIVETIRAQIRTLCPAGGDTYLPFIGSLFLFIACSSLLEIVPGWHAPTASLSTTAALAISVGVAVPVFGVLSQGFAAYFRHYLRPTAIMLPFHLLSETSRNLALAVRLFGNIMSGAMIAGMLLAIAPFFFPVPMQMLALLTGVFRHMFSPFWPWFILPPPYSEGRKDNGVNMDKVTMIGVASIVGGRVLHGDRSHRARRSAKARAIVQALAPSRSSPTNPPPSAALC